ncbi:MAG: hypothetical protein HY235_28975 [Acidobacteria bacterium]|nr:hypothetical protein [Acidobacteriota bacterium]
MNRSFDAYLVVDWSARSTPAPLKPTADAIWYCCLPEPGEPVYCRTRQEAEARIQALLEHPGRILAGFDFGFTFAAWVHRKLRCPALAFWDWLEEQIDDTPHKNNRFEVAAELNRRLSGKPFPFWATPKPLPLLTVSKPRQYGRGREEWREPEQYLRVKMKVRPQPSFKLYTTGSVGSQILVGLPMLARLRQRFAGEVSVWPFQKPERRIVFAEVYPSLFEKHLKKLAGAPYLIKDQRQVAGTARLMARADELRVLDQLMELPEGASEWREEGWIFGANANYEAVLRKVTDAVS